MSRGFRGLYLLFSLLVIVTLALPMAAAAQDDTAGDELAARARQAAQHFLNSEWETLREMMGPEMQSVFQSEDLGRVRADMEADNGAPLMIAPAWLEREQDGFLRYRVPVDFESAVLDLLLVLDAEGAVQGFFMETRLDPPDQRRLDPGPRPEIEGHWEGVIELPTTDLAVKVDLSWADGAWSGSVDIPAQGMSGAPLEFLRLDGEELDLLVVGVPGDPTFRGRLEGELLAGELTQSGMGFIFSLGRELSAGAARPQEPQPPFPYQSEDLSIDRGEFALAGTLTLPEGEGPFPAALLITGSGPQDRNEEVFEHKPFLVLADHLTRAGIAVLRVDDRGVGESGGSFDGATTADFAGDAEASLAVLRARPEVDAKRTGLIGHSEGGVIAPMIAAETEAVAYMVLMAGTGVPGDELLILQMRLQMRAAGIGDAYNEAAVEEQRRLMDLILADAPPDSLRSQVAELARVQAALAGQRREMSDEELDAAVSGPSGVATPWFRFFIAHDPGADLRRVRVPVLALNGSLDLQVDAEQNLPAISRALGEAGNEDVTAERLEGLNHLFQPAETGTIGEYYSIEQTMDPAALTLISEWILARFGD